MTNEVIEAIKSRRSVGNVKIDQVPSRETIELLLEAAIWAPNHHLTEPWRFIVLAGDSRLKLGETMSQALDSKLNEKDPDRKVKLERERQKPLRAPVIIAVIFSPSKNEKITLHEEIVAAGAALQNILLAAHSMGLGSITRTGETAYSIPVREFFKMKELEEIVGLVYLGYPNGPVNTGKRVGTRNKIEWKST